mmetsp:Transcript_16859/g.34924  ORF Transcript_16859/g.34924 Transcript_16859/m.34924 type:complete len:137 (+) Transcript_16859:547-957(+)
MLYDGGVIFRGPIEDSFIGPITTYGGYSPAWFDGYIRRSNIGAIQIHETILALDGNSTLGPVYFKNQIESSVVESIWVRVGSAYPTVFFGTNSAISSSTIGDIVVEGGSETAPASVRSRAGYLFPASESDSMRGHL